MDTLNYELMKDLATLGANLTLNTPVSYDQLMDLLAIAKVSGAHITIGFIISYDRLREIATLGGNQVTFVY
ncbi:hypothetical protein W02_31630 [Nitrospira sp. KM1]|uniref:hypothetical protein n=1 Tax=Nitrospira sp. KM1 TaxID=1936990 RepID=UPI0013A76ACD|nr:hypothetical protein [Nitrospira sp. KM1]BCA56023.1 hypothetical protein W02_31630 [Nitrospira sp. KM1]